MKYFIEYNKHNDIIGYLVIEEHLITDDYKSFTELTKDEYIAKLKDIGIEYVEEEVIVEMGDIEKLRVENEKLKSQIFETQQSIDFILTDVIPNITGVK